MVKDGVKERRGVSGLGRSDESRGGLTGDR